MITEYIRYRIGEDDRAAFEAAYAAAAASLAASSHCVDYDLSRCREEPERYVLRICWDSLDGHLQGFRKSPEFREFLSHIRPYVDRVEEMQHYETVLGGTGAGTPRAPTLFQWAGGGEKLEQLLVRFYEAVLDDDLLYPLFKDMDLNHPQHVAMWVGEVSGNPGRYTADRGGHPEMLRHHLEGRISEEQRRRWTELLVEAADAVGLPDDPEFRAAFMGYIEWGTRLAKLFSQPGAAPDFDDPVPAWDWPKPPSQG